jgi:hypothetical protein
LQPYQNFYLLTIYNEQLHTAKFKLKVHDIELQKWSQLTDRACTDANGGTHVAVESPASQASGDEVQEKVDDQQRSRQAAAYAERHGCHGSTFGEGTEVGCKLQLRSWELGDGKGIRGGWKRGGVEVGALGFYGDLGDSGQ